jgi:hypothetical protein
MRKLQEIKDNLKSIQMQYDTQGYVSTNAADEIIEYCEELIQTIENFHPTVSKKPSYMDLDDE